MRMILRMVAPLAYCALVVGLSSGRSASASQPWLAQLTADEQDQPDPGRPPRPQPPPPARQPRPGEGDGIEDRLRRLEDQVRHLAERLEQFAGPGRHEVQAPTPPIRPQGPIETSPRPDAPQFEVIGRPYHLSPGKLQALTQLMVRSDVPIQVQPQEDHLVVYATPQGHEIFGAFVCLIDPPAGAGSGGPRSQHDPAFDPQHEARQNEARELQEQARRLAEQARMMSERAARLRAGQREENE